MADYYKDKQQLTDEQIAGLAPDWCTHYEIAKSVVTFFDVKDAVSFNFKTKKMTDKFDNELGITSDDKPIPRKKFDIIEEWEGLFGFESVPFIDDEGDIFVEGGWMCEEKAILLAKHFNLTAEDLK